VKICVISSAVFPIGAGGLQGYGGLEQIAWLCAKGLAELGHQVLLVAPDGSACPGVQMHHTGPARAAAANKTPEETAYDRYWQLLLQFNDGGAIISHDWEKNAYRLKMEGRLTAPVLAVCHAPVDTMMKSPPPVPKPCIVCISEDQRTHYENIFGGQAARACPNGIDLEFYRPLNVPRSDRFLFLARFSAIKGPQIAIKAALDAGVGLDMIGDTSITNEPQLVRDCQRLAAQGKPGQINIVGNVGRGECVWWMSQAHAFVHPNRDFREPFGLAPVEALGCACPVVAWDRGAMRETITPQVGTLVKSEAELVAAMRAFAGSGGITQAMRDGCRKQAEMFSYQRMAMRYAELCAEAVAGGW
jgi:glycosyltransferase involved in cell wall biosynthesis